MNKGKLEGIFIGQTGFMTIFGLNKERPSRR
jgi:hypothetical protein